MIARKKKAIVRRETGGERIWFDEVEGKRGKVDLVRFGTTINLSPPQNCGASSCLF